VADRFYLLFLLALLAGCSGMEDGERREIRRSNSVGEYLFRREGECFFPIPPCEPICSERYPWEERYIHDSPRITRDFFRCRGNGLNPVRVVEGEGERVRCADCDGHGLPMKEGKEFIYPILINLLNEIQTKTGRRAVITCGHRCPQHNCYADPRSFNQCSKHMIGAEVDFYVEGYEDRPLEIVNLLIDHYAEDLSEYSTFARYNKDNTDVKTPPWYNKEVFVKLYLPDEGRDFDNRHPYPYLSIQVRYDRDAKEPVIYTWERARKYFRD
jgi:hypothetical protein